MGYDRIEEVSEQYPHFGGYLAGWGFVMNGDMTENIDRHRGFLELLCKVYPEYELTLPEYDNDEDYVEGNIECTGVSIRVYYENIIDYIQLWSANFQAMQSLHAAVVRLAV